MKCIECDTRQVVREGVEYCRACIVANGIARKRKVPITVDVKRPPRVNFFDETIEVATLYGGYKKDVDDAMDNEHRRRIHHSIGAELETAAERAEMMGVPIKRGHVEAADFMVKGLVEEFFR